MVNSTGKLSLGEGPAQTGRAGLGFPARGLGSLHCVFVAELGFGLSLRLTAIKSQNTITVKAGYMFVIYEFLEHVCVKIHFPKLALKEERKRPNRRYPPSTDLSTGVPLNPQCLYKTHTCIGETLYSELKGK